MSVSSISRRGAVVLSLVAPITLLQAKDAIANELIPEGEVKMSDEVRKR